MKKEKSIAEKLNRSLNRLLGFLVGVGAVLLKSNFRSPIQSRLAILVTVAVLLGVWVAPAGATGWSRTIRVTNEDDSGYGSFRAAVEKANVNRRVHRIGFKRDLTVVLDSDVVYTGRQALTIDGNGSEVIGAKRDVLPETWDGGLFVSRSAANITLKHLTFRDSLNNGVAVFIPRYATGKVRVALYDVTIDSARFHGLYIDGQDTDDYNTDDIPHPDCDDPHPHDSRAGIVLTVRYVTITNNGLLDEDYDTGELETDKDGEDFFTGCPADFDGIRVDDGGNGGITAYVTKSIIDGNLADGIEYDERDRGNVWSSLTHSSVRENGETGTIDLDDGFDIDEAGKGWLWAFFKDVTVVDNRDEGLDLDEEDSGWASVIVRNSTASGNEDQGVKVDEAGNGDLFVKIIGSSVNGSLDGEGIEFTEEDAGKLRAYIRQTEVKGNAAAAVAAEQVEPGSGLITVIKSDLTENVDPETGETNPSFDLTGVELRVIDSKVDE